MKIGEGDAFTVFDLKYMQREKIIRLTVKYHHEDFGIVERIVTVVSPAEINSII